MLIGPRDLMRENQNPALSNRTPPTAARWPTTMLRPFSSTAVIHATERHRFSRVMID
jgi:hypothetical protein